MFRRVLVLAFMLGAIAACSKTTKSSATAGAKPPKVLTELHQPTGENTFARNIYVCSGCRPAHLEALEAPKGWEKVAPKRYMPDSYEMRDFPKVPGAARDIDLVPAVPGKEHHLVARVLGGEPLDILHRVFRLRVRRSTHFEFEAGRQVHELTDDRGARYILFVVALDFEEREIEELPFPKGWTYRKRKLTEALSVDSKEETSIVAFGQQATWQRY
jgi:hypothetical protein